VNTREEIVGDFEDVGRDTSSHTARDAAINRVGGVVFVVVVCTTTVLIAGLGAAAAFEFSIDPRYSLVTDRPLRGAIIGVIFTLLLAAMVSLISRVCSSRSRSGRFTVPPWSVHSVVAILTVLSLAFLFLHLLGGIGGPYAGLEAAQEFGRSLTGWLPIIPAVSVAVVAEAAIFRRARSWNSIDGSWTVSITAGTIVGSAALVLVGIAVFLSL